MGQLTVPREPTASEGLEMPPLPGLAGEASGASLLPWESSWKPCVCARAAAALPSAPRSRAWPKVMTGEAPWGTRAKAKLPWTLTGCPEAARTEGGGGSSTLGGQKPPFTCWGSCEAPPP